MPRFYRHDFAAEHHGVGTHAWSVPRPLERKCVRIRSGEGNDIILKAEHLERLLVSAGLHRGREHAGFGVKEFAVVIPASIVHEKGLAAQPSKPRI